MEEIQEAKRQIREEMARMLASISEADLAEKRRQIEERLFDFANFQEARIPLLYIPAPGELDSDEILKRCREANKIVILPFRGKENSRLALMKVDDLKRDLRSAGETMEPDPKRCKKVPLECIDIAIVPGIAFDEKGGRLGKGTGYYDRLIPKLPATTRKVSLCLEGQLLSQIPAESHDKTVDIIITEERIIYKI